MTRDTAVRRLAIGGVVVSATILSYSTLHSRALDIGIPAWSAWFYPVLYDAFILAASRMWQNTDLSETTRRMAKWATLATIGAALLAFVGEFWSEGLVAMLSSLMIPAVLATSLVLLSRAAADRAAQMPELQLEAEMSQEQSDAPVDAHLEETTPILDEMPVLLRNEDSPTSAETITVSADAVPTKKISSVEFVPGDTKRDWINAQLDAGVELTGAMIRRQFPDVGSNGARLLKTIKEQRAKRNGVRL